jgi:hypothetical protein
MTGRTAARPPPRQAYALRAPPRGAGLGTQLAAAEAGTACSPLAAATG